jgi:hypothetical protein
MTGRRLSPLLVLALLLLTKPLPVLQCLLLTFGFLSRGELVEDALPVSLPPLALHRGLPPVCCAL